MKPNQRKHLYELYPIIWVFIFGFANAGDQPDDNKNFEISSKMDLSGEIKTNRTETEIIAINSIAYESDYQTFEGWDGEDYDYESYIDYNVTESNSTNSKTPKRIEDRAFRPIGPPPPDQSSDLFEKAVEEAVEIEVSTIVMIAFAMVICAFVSGTIGAGYCNSRPPSISESRRSINRRSTREGLSRGLSLPNGDNYENQTLIDDVFDENPVQNQNNAGAIQQV